MKERVFDPLGMVDTGFWTQPEQRARLTAVYAAQPGGGLRAYDIEEVPFTERPALLEGAVGLLSTVPDFMLFSQMLLNRGELNGVRILSPKTVDLITSNGLPEPVLRARGGGMGWGLANVNVVVDPSGDEGLTKRRRIRVGRLGRHDLLDRSEGRDGDGAHDAELAGESRLVAAAVQGAGAGGAERSLARRTIQGFFCRLVIAAG